MIMRRTTLKNQVRELRAGGGLLKLPFLEATLSLVLSGASLLGQEKLPSPQRLSGQYLRLDPKRVFRLESEATLRERMARDAQEGNNPVNLKYEISFPEYPAVPAAVPLARQWPPMAELADPAFVCYRRLYFEQINFERYGWGLGIISPILSQGAFYVDLVTLPYHIAMEPLRRYECNSGYYLPGDPAPLLLYLPEPSLAGALGEAAVIGLGFVFFP